MFIVLVDSRHQWKQFKEVNSTECYQSFWGQSAFLLCFLHSFSLRYFILCPVHSFWSWWALLNDSRIICFIPPIATHWLDKEDGACCWILSLWYWNYILEVYPLKLSVTKEQILACQFNDLEVTCHRPVHGLYWNFFYSNKKCIKKNDFRTPYCIHDIRKTPCKKQIIVYFLKTSNIFK